MYKIELDIEEPEIGSWGEFQVLKGYRVTDVKGNPANGYIIQKIEKRTDGSKYVRVNEDEPEDLAKRIRKVIPADSKQIADLTSNQVKWSNHSYYEIFPIVNGVSVDKDQFQNGAILAYDREKRQWFANDDPLTSGKIEMVGTNVFVPTTPEEAKRIQAAIDDPKVKTIKINGIDWVIRGETPANGIPYRDATSPGKFNFPNTPAVIHKVIVKWEDVDKDGKKSGKTTVDSKVGGRRKTIRARAASKSYRKRRIGKATRRSRDRV